VKHSLTVLAGFLLVGSSGFCAEPAAENPKDPAEVLKEIEARIKETPGDPMLLYRKAQYQTALGKHDEGYQTAKEAMALFMKKGNSLAWMMIERIDLGNR
jgi:hypothetical protein